VVSLSLKMKSTVAVSAPRTFERPGSTVLRANCRTERRNLAQ
jgi:hypothetical protein